MIIYDCEIKKAIQGKDEEKNKTLQYCQGWADFPGMGISVICAYDCSLGSYRVFMDDNLGEFQTLINAHNIVVGWNNHRFDDKLIQAHGITLRPEKSWDLKAALMRTLGLDPDKGKDHHGISLGEMARLNTSCAGKSGHGSQAPALYQTGKIGSLVDYCLNDVRLTRVLIGRVRAVGSLITPGWPTCKIKLPTAII